MSKSSRTFALLGNMPPLSKQQLWQQLREKTKGAMDVLVDPSVPGFALALFESKETARQAAKSQPTLDVDGTQHTPTWRLIQKEPRRKIEFTFQSTIDVEGEMVEKSALAFTKGLEEVLKSAEGLSKVVGVAIQTRAAAPRWCERTRRNEDCPEGRTCPFLHKRTCQHTLHPTGGIAPALDAGIISAVAATVSSVACKPNAELVLAEEDVRLLAAFRPLTEATQMRLREVLSKRTQPSFIRLDVPHGAPSDAGLWPGAAPTTFESPVARDTFLHRAFTARAASLAVTTVEEATALLLRSEKVRRACASQTPGAAVRLLIQPWLDVADPTRELQLVVSEGRVVAAAQRNYSILCDLVNRRAAQHGVGGESFTTEVAAAEARRVAAHAAMEAVGRLVAETRFAADVCINVAIPSGAVPVVLSIESAQAARHANPLLASNTPGRIVWRVLIPDVTALAPSVTAYLEGLP